MFKKTVTRQRLRQENTTLRARLENAQKALRDLLGGEADTPAIANEVDQSYRILIESMGEGALTLTPEGVVLYSNLHFAEILGVPLENVIGSEIRKWFAPQSRQMLQEMVQNDTLESRREELALLSADGIEVPIYLSVNRQVSEGRSDLLYLVVTDLTYQKVNEEMLADDGLARAILEQATDAIVICDGTGQILRASKQAQTFSSKNLHGRQFESVFPLRRLDGRPFSVIGSSDKNTLQSVEATLQYKGEEFIFLVSIGYLNGAEGELLGSVITMTDITRRKAQELALQKSEQQLSEALTISRIGYWEYEAATDEFIFNDQYYLLHKVTAEEVGGYRMSVADYAGRFLHPDDLSILVGNAQLALASRDRDYSGMAQVRLLTGEGEIVWVDVRFGVVKDESGNTLRMFGVNQDITERKLAELKLLASERRFTDLLGNINLISVMRDREEKISYCNEYLLRLTGWQYDEVIGQNWFEVFVPPEIADQRKNVFADLLVNEPEARHLSSEIITRSRERRLIRWNNTVLRSEDGEIIGTASIGEDITEQKKAEARIKDLNRVYAVLSGINTLIVRAKDRAELFDEACQTAVKVGGFRMAMVVVVDKREAQPVSLTSVGMDDELLRATRNVLASKEAKGNFFAQSIGDKKEIVLNDVANDPVGSHGKKYADYGVLSLVVLPLIIEGEAVGALTLYSDSIDFFQSDEIDLLTELAGDVAFAMDHIDKQSRLEYLAYYDELTGLANRNLFLERVAHYMRSAIAGNHKLALFQLDIERFKNINDTLGRNAGDELLKLVSEWLKSRVSDTNLLARIDMDHFALIIPEVKQDGDLQHLIEKTMGEFSRHPFQLDEAVFRINAKVGIAIFPDDGTEADILLRNAEAALKSAKSGGARYLFHTKQMTESVARKLTLENQLRQAIDNEEFVLYYQPKMNLVNREVTSAEALIRWNKPGAGLIPPFEFIPILEESGLIHEVGRWALQKAAMDYLRWRDAGLLSVRVAVNVSALQLRNPTFIDEVKQTVTFDPDTASGLELEITESLIMEDIHRNITALKALRALGVTIAIDDFGTGFSSLSYLARLPVDTLKIDRSFIVDMTASPEGLALVSTIINLAHSMNLKVVAEGVETEEQSHLLHLLRCDETQGFLFSKPVPDKIFEAQFLGSATLKKSK